ncbi:MAG: hypothetical protein CM15mP106_2870 [Candidatus Neomarinimicrobiota bacterium]|nr:MAG: hypothetical protein CM15mP106_2870 [Candidatus Neomarinimicrobiota bacterium]
MVIGDFSDVFDGLHALSDSPNGDYQDGQETLLNT